MMRPTDAALQGWTGETGDAVPFWVTGAWEAEVDWAGTPDGSDWHFVIGLGRSGTSVMSRLLSEHPDVHCGCEDNTVFSVMGLLSSRRVVSEAISLIAYNGEQCHGWRRGMTGPRLREFADAWRRAYCWRASFVGDKSTHYLVRREWFRKAFPGCKFVFTVRNPLDQLASHLKAGWTIKLDDELWARRDAEAEELKLAQSIETIWRIEEMIGWYQAVRDEPDVLIVPFEELCYTDQIQGAMKRVYEWIGADPESVGADGLAQYAIGDGIRRRASEPRLRMVLECLERHGRIDAERMSRLDVPGTGYIEAMDGWETTTAGSLTP